MKCDHRFLLEDGEFPSNVYFLEPLWEFISCIELVKSLKCIKTSCPTPPIKPRKCWPTFCKSKIWITLKVNFDADFDVQQQFQTKIIAKACFFYFLFRWVFGSFIRCRERFFHCFFVFSIISWKNNQFDALFVLISVRCNKIYNFCVFWMFVLWYITEWKHQFSRFRFCTIFFLLVSVRIL